MRPQETGTEKMTGREWRKNRLERIAKSKNDKKQREKKKIWKDERERERGRLRKKGYSWVSVESPLKGDDRYGICCQMETQEETQMPRH